MIFFLNHFEQLGGAIVLRFILFISICTVFSGVVFIYYIYILFSGANPFVQF